LQVAEEVAEEEVAEELLLDVLLDGQDLGLDLAALVLGDAGGDDRPGHPARPAQSLLGPHEDVRQF
jgi:hypothetical protein